MIKRKFWSCNPVKGFCQTFACSLLVLFTVQHSSLVVQHSIALEMVSILVLIFQQQSTTTGDNFHHLPVTIPVSSNNGSDESYGSRPGSREAVGVGPSLPVSSSARITADHMNGRLQGNATGITGRILKTEKSC